MSEQQESPEYREALSAPERLRAYYLNTLGQIICESSFCNVRWHYSDDDNGTNEAGKADGRQRSEISAERNRRREEEDIRIQIAIRELQEFCGTSGILPDVEAADLKERGFPRERILDLVSDEVRVWEKDNQTYLVVNQSLRETFSPENLARSEIFEGKPDHEQQELARHASRLIMAYYEAKTGTTDMPISTVIGIDTTDFRVLEEINNLRKQQLVSRFGNSEDGKNIPIERDGAGEISMRNSSMASIIEQCFKRYHRSQIAVKAHHGWTGDRWVMAEGEAFWVALQGAGTDGIGILYSGMGAEGTAGWKITERGIFTSEDYAKQIHTTDALLGNYYDKEVRDMHSHGGHAGLYLREYYDQILAKLKEAGLPDLPSLAYLLANPALPDANIFLENIPGFLIKAALARVGFQVSMSENEYRAMAAALRWTKDRNIFNKLDSAFSDILVDKYLLAGVDNKVRLSHKQFFHKYPQIAVAQARGLLDRVSLKTLTRIIDNINVGSTILVVVSKRDRFVGRKRLAEKLGPAVSRGLLRCVLLDTGHYARMDRAYCKVAYVFVAEQTGNKVNENFIEKFAD